MDFEERELCSDAIPLRPSPDEIIAGRPGLVRSLMLNDRQHVISVDTEGEVAVWNIITGTCIGKFSSADVADALDLERDMAAGKAVRKHSNEVLEMVKDRIEGETMVITWCQVDTKIGSLVVHLEEGRVFDAETYIDDLHLEGAEAARDDARGESAYIIGSCQS
jgi:WD repeat-containing protein 48